MFEVQIRDDRGELRIVAAEIATSEAIIIRVSMDDEPDPGRDQPLQGADVQPPASGAGIQAGEEAAGCDEDHAYVVPLMCDALT